MASFIIGFVVGIYTGAILREEYEFPTSEKVSQALDLFRRNKSAILKARQEYEAIHSKTDTSHKQ
jgi:hypothetical protein